ncbi:MAG: hypothetical protein ACRD4L_02665 [Pyrinomonadaceae bacterium]
MSTAIIIQDIDETTAKWISDEAERRGVSVEALILELISKGIGVECEDAKLQTYHDLDSLAGTWSDEQATEFMNAITDFEQVDEKLWQRDKF